jgi:hypothetical protein
MIPSSTLPAATLLMSASLAAISINSALFILYIPPKICGQPARKRF